MSLLKKYLSERSRTESAEPARNVNIDYEQEVSEQRLVSASPPNALNFAKQLRKFDLDQERIAVHIDEISYVPNAVPVQCANAISECVESGGYSWKQLKTRRLKYFGGLPEKGRPREALPPWLEEISTVLVERGIFPPHLAPNHVLVNQYQPGEGIMHHTDGPLYHDCVVILSVGFPALMSFRPRLSPEQIGCASNKSNQSGATDTLDTVSVVLQPNSLLYFSNEAYSSYLHGIDIWGDHQTKVLDSNEESPQGQNWCDQFRAHVSSISNVIEKTCDHSAEWTQHSQSFVTREKLCEEYHDSDCVRTSLTIRHMF